MGFVTLVVAIAINSLLRMCVPPQARHQDGDGFQRGSFCKPDWKPHCWSSDPSGRWDISGGQRVCF